MDIVTVERKILEKNEDIAQSNRAFFNEKEIIVLDLISSPGSGKTALLEKTLGLIRDDIRTAVIEGDVQTDRDAQRIAKLNIPVVQIVTNGGCHLDATLIKNALDNLPVDSLDLIFIENVGNLVCPAEFDLGENQKIVIMSATEGDDKPLKYPLAFQVASTCVLNKIDLLPYVDFDVAAFRSNLKKVNPKLQTFDLSAKTGEGMEGWVEWLKDFQNQIDQ